MREILFRGKDIKGNWHIGLLAHIRNAWYISNKAGVSTAFEVIPETIGQYTGLTDKNGKKIFEGDIHKCGENLWLVTFGEFYDMDVTDYEYGWYCKKINSKHAEAFGLNGAESGYMNIIGNIHDNPELLKGGE